MAGGGAGSLTLRRGGAGLGLEWNVYGRFSFDKTVPVGVCGMVEQAKGCSVDVVENSWSMSRAS